MTKEIEYTIFIRCGGMEKSHVMYMEEACTCYSFSFKAKFSLFLYHQLKFMYLWRKLKVKNNCINRARLYRLTKKYGCLLYTSYK